MDENQNISTFGIPANHKVGGSKKKLIFLFLLLVIIVAGYFIYNKYTNNINILDKKDVPVVVSERKIEQITNNQISKYFPENLPIAPILKIIENENVYYSKNGINSTQSIIKYIRPNNSDKNQTTFEKYFSENGWKVYYLSPKTDKIYEINTYKLKSFLGVKIENYNATTSLVTLIMSN